MPKNDFVYLIYSNYLDKQGFAWYRSIYTACLEKRISDHFEWETSLYMLVHNLKSHTKAVLEAQTATTPSQRTQTTLKRITSSRFLWRWLWLSVNQPQPNHCSAVFYTHLLCVINSALQVGTQKKNKNPQQQTHPLLALWRTQHRFAWHRTTTSWNHLE